MRAICWHCGEAVTYPPFAKSKEVFCPDCGEAVTVYMTQANKDLCPRCRTELFEPVRGTDWALGALRLLIWVGVLVFVLLFPVKEWTVTQRLMIILLAFVLVGLLDIPHNILLRRAYLRRLERYRSGAARPPRSTPGP